MKIGDMTERPLTLSEVMRLIAKQLLNDIVVDNHTALRMIQFYPVWNEFIGKTLYVGNKIQYEGKLFEVRQTIITVLESQPPSVATASLYKQIDEEHAGTFDDPIPYDLNMALEFGKYYVQYDVKYKCIRDTINPVYNDLKDLVGIYVEVASESTETSQNEAETTQGDEIPSDGENTENGGQNEPEEGGADEPSDPDQPEEPVIDDPVVEEPVEGSLENPISFEQGMTIYDGKYYIQNGVKYKCIRDSINGLYYDLNALIGLYVEEV